METGTPRDDVNRRDGCRLSFAAATFVAVAGLIALAFAVQFGLPVLVSDDTALARFPGREVWIVMHVSTGSVALLIAPIQILSLYWTIPGQLHRFSGAVYVGAIVLSCVAGLYLAVAAENGLVYRFGLGGLAAAWSVTTGVGSWAVYRRHFAQHSQWMIRSCVVTFAFVFFRGLVLLLSGLQWGTMTERLTLASWSCWVLPLLVTEVFIRRHPRNVRWTIPVESGDS